MSLSRKEGHRSSLQICDICEKEENNLSSMIGQEITDRNTE